MLNIYDLQKVLERLDAERARIEREAQQKLSEIDHDREKIQTQVNELNQIAAKYSVNATPVYAAPRQDVFDGSMKSLIHYYLTDPRSPIHKLRHATKTNYAGLLKRIEESDGDAIVGDLTEADIRRMHDKWSDGGKRLPIAHSLITMVRSLAVYGTDIMKDDRCQRLSYVLHRMKFKPAPIKGGTGITEEQVKAIIAKANEMDLASIGLTQALMYYTPLRQKDCIGEWIPITEPEQSEIYNGDTKWVRGVRWEQIDDNWVLRHTTSKESELVVENLANHPVLMEQIRMIGRDTGPMIICESRDRPWLTVDFRRKWRNVARAAGIPDSVKNRDSGSAADED